MFTGAVVVTTTDSMMREGLVQLVPAVAQLTPVTVVPLIQEQACVAVAVMLVTFGASWVAAVCIPEMSEAVMWL